MFNFNSSVDTLQRVGCIIFSGCYTFVLLLDRPSFVTDLCWESQLFLMFCRRWATLFGSSRWSIPNLSFSFTSFFVLVYPFLRFWKSCNTIIKQESLVVFYTLTTGLLALKFLLPEGLVHTWEDILGGISLEPCDRFRTIHKSSIIRVVYSS